MRTTRAATATIVTMLALCAGGCGMYLPQQPTRPGPPQTTREVDTFRHLARELEQSRTVPAPATHTPFEA
jgi:hypothetical protein